MSEKPTVGQTGVGLLEAGEQLGRAFIESLVSRDFALTASLLHPDLSFRGLTPGRYWEAEPPVISSALAILKQWFFEGDDTLEEILRCSVERVGRTRFGERFKLSYAFRAKSPSSCESYAQRNLGTVAPDADWVVRQEAYYDVRDARVAWMIVLCGGYQPLHRAT